MINAHLTRQEMDNASNITTEEIIAKEKNTSCVCMKFHDAVAVNSVRLTVCLILPK